MSENKKSFVYHGGILAITTLLVRLIGLIYRIPMYHIIGQVGMGYYSSAFQVYAFLLMISAFGIPVAMSKLISKEVALRREGNIKIIFRAVLFMSASVGLILSLLLYFYSEKIAVLIGNSGSALAIKALAPALFILSILSVFRGFFQGFKTMIPTAISQLIEQVFNATFSVLLVYLLFKKGLTHGAAGGALGTGIGALSALVFMIFIYYLAESGKRRTKTGDEMTYSQAGKLILVSLVPMIFSASIYNLPSVVDMILFQRGQAFHGLLEADISSLYGLFSTKYLMIIAVPISMASVFAVSSLPSISASFAKGNKRAFISKSNLAIKIAMLISLPSMAGVIVLAQPIIYLIFDEVSLEYAAKILMLGSGAIIMSTISSISTSILQGMDELMKPVYNALIAMFVKIAALFLLIYAYNLSLYGVLISTYLFGIVSISLNFRSIRKRIMLKINFMNVIIKPFIATIIMSVVAALSYYGIGVISKNNTVAVIITIILSVFVYAFSIIKFKTLSKKELATLGGIGSFAMRFM